ncbi:MAG: hypothetical protein IPH04_13890 [Saprospirales bacterium]|nr:hypothetical protein [Saprospirales bacterium]
MNKILTVLRASKLMDNSLGEYGYGGLNRTFQLETIWRKKNIETIHIDEISRAISTNRIQRILSALLLWLNGFRFAINKWMIGQCGQRSLIVLNALKSYKGVKILFLEDTYDFISFFLAKKMGYKTVAFPHNFETLMPGPVNDFFTNKPWPYNVMEELKHLRNCDAVFCISREEQWWLRANGIPAYYLPYFPIDEKMKGLLAIRKRELIRLFLKRSFNPCQKNHRHTRDGTIKLIQILNRLIDGRNDIRILIGGYESEFFETFISSKI